jgi:uncharacterized protein YecT (DUF1311 family)
MNDVITELWAALKALNGPQWVVLLALAFFFSFGLFLLFRWLYGARLEAQGSLIDLKDKTIEHYKSIHAERSKPRPLSEIVPDAWEPYLEQPYQQLEELLEQTVQQQTMNYTSANLGFVRDAELYILYLKIFHSLSPDRAETFKHDQERWLKERKIFCESSAKSHGGTLAPLEYGMAFIQRTNERIHDFKHRV